MINTTLTRSAGKMEDGDDRILVNTFFLCIHSFHVACARETGKTGKFKLVYL